MTFLWASRPALPCICIADHEGSIGTTRHFPRCLHLAPPQRPLLPLPVARKKLLSLPADLLTMCNYSCLHLKTYLQSHLLLREERPRTSQHPASFQGEDAAGCGGCTRMREGEMRDKGFSSLPPSHRGVMSHILASLLAMASPGRKAVTLMRRCFCKSKWPPCVDLEGFRGARQAACTVPS